jgi:hypothetical protein
MDLTDGRRGDRLDRKLGEQLRRTLAAEFLTQSILDVAIGTRRDLVLQALELLAEGIGEEVRHDADELPHLDEQAA